MTITNEQLRKAAADSVLALSKKSEDIKFEIEENTGAIETKGDNIEKAVKTSQKAISGHLKDVEKAIKEQEVAETVTIKNPEAITGDLKAGLEGIIATFKDELKNFDKNIVVKNDFSNFASLFKSSQDKTSVINALTKIENGIRNLEKEEIDYTLILSDIAETLENRDAVDLLKKILEKELTVNIPDIMPVDLDPNLIEKDRIKVTMSDEQVKAMSAVGTSNSRPIVEAINDISDQQVATDLEGNGKTSVGVTALEIAFTGETESIIITADPDNAGTLYIGKSDVASDGSNAITFLQASESLELDYEDSTNALYVVASEASQNYWAGALT